MSDERKDDGGPALTGWQPIETAPKDRTEVLLAWSSGLVRSGHRDNHWAGGPCWTTSSGMYFPSNGPTHWQPLPAPPQAGER